MSNKIANPNSQNYPKVGVSQAFHNKILKSGSGKAAWGNSYEPSQLEPNKLFQHILSGGAWTPGIFEGNQHSAELYLKGTLDQFLQNEYKVVHLAELFIRWFGLVRGDHTVLANCRPQPSPRKIHKPTIG